MNNHPMRIFRVALACFVAAFALLPGCSCSKGSSEESIKAVEGEQAPRPFRGLVEEHEDGKVEWEVLPDGKIRARVSGADGKTIAPGDVQGKVGVAGDWTKLEESGEVLAASVPKLKGDLTDIEYSITVKEKEWTGTLQVPPGGTDDLLVEPSATVPEGTRGPNGGIVETIDGQRVELVTDKKTGEMRIYFLDEKNKVIPPPPDAEITIGIVEGKGKD